MIGVAFRPIEAVMGNIWCWCKGSCFVVTGYTKVTLLYLSPLPSLTGSHRVRFPPEQQSDWSVQRRRRSSHVPSCSHDQARGAVPGSDPAVGSNIYTKGHVTVW